MPTNVVLFERLMYASLCIGLLNLVLDGPRVASAPEMQEVGGAPFFAVVALGTLGVLLLFIWLIARKAKNWARLLFAALFAIGLVPTIQNIGNLLEANPPVAALSVAQIIVQLAAIYFIFTGDAPAWFAKPAKA